MFVKNHCTTASCLGTSISLGYCKSILHLIRPMSKICFSSIFSISLAEFFSSNNLIQTLDSVKCKETIERHKQFLFSANNFRLNYILLLNLLNTSSDLIEKTPRECKLLKIVNQEANKMAKINQSPVSVVAAVPTVAAVQKACSPKMPLSCPCRPLRTEDMVG